MRTLDLNLDGEDYRQDGPPNISPLWGWQGNALRLDCDLASTLDLMEDTATIHAEIHTNTTPGGDTPLASSYVAVGDGDNWEIDFTAAQMNFSIGSEVESLTCYLFITARNEAGDALQSLFAGRIEIKAGTYSGNDPEATGAAFSLVDNGDGTATITAGLVSIKVPLVL